MVPPIALALAKHPMIDEYDLSSLEGLMRAPHHSVERFSFRPARD